MYILGSAYYTLLASMCSMCTLYLKRFCESVRFERMGLPEVFEMNTYPTIGSFLLPHLNCGNYQFMSKAIRTALFGNQCVFLECPYFLSFSSVLLGTSLGSPFLPPHLWKIQSSLVTPLSKGWWIGYNNENRREIKFKGKAKMIINSYQRPPDSISQGFLERHFILPTHPPVREHYQCVEPSWLTQELPSSAWFHKPEMATGLYLPLNKTAIISWTPSTTLLAFLQHNTSHSPTLLCSSTPHKSQVLTVWLLLALQCCHLTTPVFISGPHPLKACRVFRGPPHQGILCRHVLSLLPHNSRSQNCTA